MIFRLWHASIHPARVEEFNAFSREHAGPMFGQLPGFMGVFYLQDLPNVMVLTLWQDMAAAKAVAGHALYQNTVANLQATGILRDMKAVSYYHLQDAALVLPELFAPYVKLP